MSSQEIDAKRPLVFVVDDDEDTRENLRDILELDGYRVCVSGSARELFASPGWDDVSVVLLDRKLPDASPQEIVSRVHLLAPDAGVIVVTGYRDIEGAVSCLQAGVRDYIVKPVNASALLASVGRELDRQTNAASLASSQQRHRALFESATDGFLILDKQWQIVEANPAACATLGYDSDQILGRRLREFFDPEAQKLELPTSDTERVRIAGECRMIRCDGIPIDIEFRVVSNFTLGLQLFSLRDVTDRKKAEERAQQSERLAAIGETMAALVHESRNALQRSSASLELLEIEVEDRPEALKLVARTKLAQEQLHQLFEEVRQWAAPLNLSRQECNLKGVWREAWEQVHQVQRVGHVGLEEQIEYEPICRIDRSMMYHVFRNTFENAIEVMPEGGTIFICCSNRSSNGHTSLKILIRDEGPGMSPEQCARIFEPFFTTKTKGTGLGMALCQRIVHAHEGVIAASSPGGAQIEILLPVCSIRADAV